jgi:hypothetical protein
MNLLLTMPQEHSRTHCKYDRICVLISSQQAKVFNNSQGIRLKVPSLCLAFPVPSSMENVFFELRLSFSYIEVFCEINPDYAIGTS